MKYAKKLRQNMTVELVPRGFCLQVIPMADNTCRVTTLPRNGGEPGTPIILTGPFESEIAADHDQVFHIEAMTDEPVYYLVSQGRQAGIVLEEDPQRVPLE